MKKVIYSTYIGIALPESYRESFSRILDSLDRDKLGLRTVSRHNPHITLLFLGDQPAEALDEIKHVLSKKVIMERSFDLSISGLKTFSEQSPQVVYLAVKSTPRMNFLERELSADLAPFLNQKTESFIPHLTLGRLPSGSARRKFQMCRDSISKFLQSVHWQFSVREIVLFGKETTGGEHRALASFPLKK